MTTKEIAREIRSAVYERRVESSVEYEKLPSLYLARLEAAIERLMMPSEFVRQQADAWQAVYAACRKLGMEAVVGVQNVIGFINNQSGSWKETIAVCTRLGMAAEACVFDFIRGLAKRGNNMSDSNFKFQIGEVVTHRLAPGTDRLFIVERAMQECPGGVQIHYDCRCGGNRGLSRGELVRFNEIELLPLPAEDPQLKAVECLAIAKEWAVENAEFDLAAAIRDLADRVKKFKLPADPEEAPVA